VDLLSGIASLQSSGSRRVGAYRSCTANLQTDRLLDRWHALVAFTEIARSLFQLRSKKMDANNAALAPANPPPSSARHGMRRRRVMQVDLRTQLRLLQRSDPALNVRGNFV
jgi:hypothetical protein